MTTMTATMIETIKAYTENDMCVQAASENMFIHYNTLQYRLRQFYKKTGLNPRKFNDLCKLVDCISNLEKKEQFETLKTEIKHLKDMQKSESHDYYIGYMSALSTVEGLIAIIVDGMERENESEKEESAYITETV